MKMTTLGSLAKQAERFTLDNAPSIMTGIGMVGTVITTYFTARATFQAHHEIDEECRRRFHTDPKFGDEGNEDISTFDKIKLVWPLYIPAASTLVISLTAAACANRISTKRAVAMAAAYSLSEGRFAEYKSKVVEKFNPNKETEVRSEIAQDRVSDKPPREGQIVMTGLGDTLFYDQPSDRYFTSDIEKVRRIQNDINQQVLHVGCALLSDLYTCLQMNSTPYSEEVGWTTDNLLDLKFSAVLTDQSKPCICIDYAVEPIRGFNQEPPF
jgi:hypothetical protein